MALHLPPLTRRSFLTRAAAAMPAAMVFGGLHAQAASASTSGGGGRFALLSDTHISGDADEVKRGVNMSANLRRVLAQVLAHRGGFDGVVISGDCAKVSGRADDYAQLTRLLQPVTAAGLPVYLTLGNHDDREVFTRRLQPWGQPAVSDRVVSVLETRLANWFLLDSLEHTGRDPGRFGDAQLQWLAAALDARPDKPAIIVAHHTMQWDIARSLNKDGLRDTRAFYALIKPRRQVKAYVFGHSHHYRLSVSDGIYFINLPPTAWLFDEARPRGWVETVVDAAGVTLTLHALAAHRDHGRPRRLNWRV